MKIHLKANLQKVAVVLLFVSSFVAGYTLKISFEGLNTNFKAQESAYAGPNWGKITKTALVFLGIEITKGSISVGVDSVLSPKGQASNSISPQINTPNQSIYAGSFFQCSRGCKYYWSQAVGWLAFNPQQGVWQQIPYPSQTVVLTHDIYINNGGYLFTLPVPHKYGFDPRYGWVYF